MNHFSNRFLFAAALAGTLLVSSSTLVAAQASPTHGLYPTPSMNPTPSMSPTSTPAPSPTAIPNPTATPTPDSSSTVPAFPACMELLDQPGDVASYDYGNPHQIVGGSILYGSDDVYSVGNGNYVQCFCPDEGSQGIQTNWWRTNDIIAGWFQEFGQHWNLGDHYYLAQNNSFSCENEVGGDLLTPTPNPTQSTEPTPTTSTDSSKDSSSESDDSAVGGATHENKSGGDTLPVTELAPTGIAARALGAFLMLLGAAALAATKWFKPTA